MALQGRHGSWRYPPGRLEDNNVWKRMSSILSWVDINSSKKTSNAKKRKEILRENERESAVAAVVVVQGKQQQTIQSKQNRNKQEIKKKGRNHLVDRANWCRGRAMKRDLFRATAGQPDDDDDNDRVCKNPQVVNDVGAQLSSRPSWLASVDVSMPSRFISTTYKIGQPDGWFSWWVYPTSRR